MEVTLDNLGEAIREARLHCNMTQKQLAEQLHISSRHLMTIEKGNQKPSYSLLRAMVTALAIPPDNLFYDKEHSRNELEEVIAMLHYCDDHELAVISAALHMIMRFKN
jgi:transcriptional regulator with XRE-family HTH domain